MKSATKQDSEKFGDVLSRRLFLKGSLAALPAIVVGKTLLGGAEAVSAQLRKDSVKSQLVGTPSNLTFNRISLDSTDTITIPANYRTQTLIGWGDPIFQGAPGLNLNSQSKATQEQQFGFNCDFVAYFPLAMPNLKGHKSNGRSNLTGSTLNGILTVNHEYTDGDLMFPNYDANNRTANEVDADIAAHGASVIEIQKDSKTGDWSVVLDSQYNRRITGFTPMILTGPAAGDQQLQTSEDPTGTSVLGMFNNCGGGTTPWGTLLTCEENFNQYFATPAPLKHMHSNRQ